MSNVEKSEKFNLTFMILIFLDHFDIVDSSFKGSFMGKFYVWCLELGFEYSMFFIQGKFVYFLFFIWILNLILDAAQKKISVAQSWIETRWFFNILSVFPQFLSKSGSKSQKFWKNLQMRPRDRFGLATPVLEYNFLTYFQGMTYNCFLILYQIQGKDPKKNYDSNTLRKLNNFSSKRVNLVNYMEKPNWKYLLN
jgi:hypothetical protein